MRPGLLLLAAALLAAPACAPEEGGGSAAPAAGEPGPGGQAWHRDFASGIEAARSSDRLLLVVFTEAHCQPCERLRAEILPHPEITRETERMARVLLEIREDGLNRGLLSARFGAETVPFSAVLDPDTLEERGRLDGAPGSPQEYAAFLRAARRAPVSGS